jgi:cell division ATPase FtsA
MFYGSVVTILEVNSVSVRLIAFKRSDDFFRPLVSLKSNYDGFEGKLLNNPNQFFITIQNLFAELSKKIKYLSNKVYVILPQGFIRTYVAESDVSISGKIVKEQDVVNLCKKCVCNDFNYSVINYTPISFKSLNYPIMFNPVGQSCDKLYGKISCICLDKKIKEFFDTASKSLKKSFAYVGESNALIEKLDKDLQIPSGLRLVVNMRQEQISVNLCKGKAIIASNTIEWGANHIYYALQDLLDIKLPMAKRLVEKLDLNVKCDSNDTYILNDGKDLYEFNMQAINKRVIETLSFIADNIKKIVKSFKIEGSLPVYITGNDVCMVRGAREIINNAIDGEMIDTVLPNRADYVTADDYILVAQLENILNTAETNDYWKFLAKHGRN